MILDHSEGISVGIDWRPQLVSEAGDQTALVKGDNVSLAHISDLNIEVDLVIHGTERFANELSLNPNSEVLLEGHHGAIRVEVHIEWHLGIATFLDLEGRSVRVEHHLGRRRGGSGTCVEFNVFVLDSHSDVIAAGGLLTEGIDRVSDIVLERFTAPLDGPAIESVLSRLDNDACLTRCHFNLEELGYLDFVVDEGTHEEHIVDSRGVCQSGSERERCTILLDEVHLGWVFRVGWDNLIRDWSTMVCTSIVNIDLGHPWEGTESVLKDDLRGEVESLALQLRLRHHIGEAGRDD